jgi:hypothetical protein
MKATIENRKQTVRDMAGIDPALIAKIPRLDSFPEVILGRKKLSDLEEQKKTIEQKLNDLYDGFVEGQSVKMPTVASDAEKVLGGAAVSELTSQSVDTIKQNLSRQKQVLEQAILIQTEVNRMAEVRIIREVCENKLRPYAEKFVRDVLEDFEKLAEHIEIELKFFTYLSSLGYIEGHRPTGFYATDYEKNYYFGGNGVWAMRYFIENRRQTWKLDEKK